MADYVQIPPDSSGKLIDAPGVINESGVLVQRERVIVGDLAAAIYNALMAVSNPTAFDSLTGRLRVTIDGANSLATVAVGNVATLGGGSPRDILDWNLEWISWATNVGTRII